ncbi:hypothetical protein L8R85_02165 [Vibrio splendidus]|uniref:DUF1640 domain-containing protein n=2 Tax=Vibrio TaxID=662 RepID=A0AA43FUL2_VIBSP|nr:MULTISPECIES: hypothetical protein [Vibrio]MDH5919821.1 hypothetical protein [Vibrio splendidus]TCT46136.1 hypothetical protein EDB39_1148 [Vibrio crassostreae]TCT54257.1 hypothetical protein EDB40_114144 [Vibrio crassostreae]TCT58876.1 hypothetical protein EDB44_11811 [Vibrio crassostreae]TCT80191.1 hypothetical protein EDB43_11811 [Vibrio crassostreae]
MTHDNTITIPAEKVIEAFLHGKQFEQHYATQESVDNLKERMNEKFEQVDKRFEQVDKRFDKLESKVDKILWFIIATSITMIGGGVTMAFWLSKHLPIQN